MNQHALVVDASVALKCVLEEEFSPNARALLSDSVAKHRAMLAPPLLPSEVTNVIYQRERRRLISPAESNDALTSFLALSIRLAQPLDLFADTLALAREYGLSATYDSQYLALARHLDAELWTADRTLIRSLPHSLRWVRWIGDYRSSPKP